MGIPIEDEIAKYKEELGLLYVKLNKFNDGGGYGRENSNEYLYTELKADIVAKHINMLEIACLIMEKQERIRKDLNRLKEDEELKELGI